VRLFYVNVNKILLLFYATIHPQTARLLLDHCRATRLFQKDSREKRGFYLLAGGVSGLFRLARSGVDACGHDVRAKTKESILYYL
jgi:hypothetical protein